MGKLLLNLAIISQRTLLSLGSITSSRDKVGPGRSQEPGALRQVSQVGGRDPNVELSPLAISQGLYEEAPEGAELVLEPWHPDLGKRFLKFCCTKCKSGPIPHTNEKGKQSPHTPCSHHSSPPGFHMGAAKSGCKAAFISAENSQSSAKAPSSVSSGQSPGRRPIDLLL